MIRSGQDFRFDFEANWLPEVPPGTGETTLTCCTGSRVVIGRVLVRVRFDDLSLDVVEEAAGRGGAAVSLELGVRREAWISRMGGGTAGQSPSSSSSSILSSLSIRLHPLFVDSTVCATCAAWWYVFVLSGSVGTV